MTDQPSLPISRLGAEGDGIAEGPDGQPVYVPFALPGERVANAGHGAVIETSPDRVTPPCPHFAHCGGCVAQHMSATLYRRWKQEIVATAFRQRGLDIAIDDLVTVPPASRRRATFSIAARGDVLGYHRRHSSEVINLETCPVLTPKLVAALPGLRKLAAALPGLDADTRMAVADLDGGIDVAISGLKSEVAGNRRAGLAQLAAEAGIGRLTIDGIGLVERAKVSLPTQAGAIVPPPGGFFQAVAAAEQAMVAAVLAAVPAKAKRVADLFCGLGTLSLPLAKRARVIAADGDKASLEALTAATRNNQGLKPIETKYRDLFREPLSVKELEGLDAVVLDPPRAGAREQCVMLAKSKVPVVVMLSCNPATMARDAKVLVDAGFKLTRITPIDQFLWSAHVEVVAVFRR